MAATNAKPQFKNCEKASSELTGTLPIPRALRRLSSTPEPIRPLTKGRHDLLCEGAHPGHEVFNRRAEVGADVFRAGLLEGVDFREDGIRVAGQRRAGTQFDAAAIGGASHLLGPPPEVLRAQPR